MKSEMANISDKLGSLTAPREAKETEDEGNQLVPKLNKQNSTKLYLKRYFLKVLYRKNNGVFYFKIIWNVRKQM